MFSSMHSASNLVRASPSCWESSQIKRRRSTALENTTYLRLTRRAGVASAVSFNRFPILVEFDVLASLHKDQCMPVRQSETVQCPRLFETAQLLAFHVELDNVANARRQRQHVTVVQYLIAAAPASHYGNLLDL